MTNLVLNDLSEPLVRDLAERASRHGRTVEEEAKEILAATLRVREERWRAVDEIHSRLVASGRTFSDSADLLREDRDR